MGRHEGLIAAAALAAAATAAGTTLYALGLALIAEEDRLQRSLQWSQRPVAAHDRSVHRRRSCVAASLR